MRLFGTSGIRRLADKDLLQLAFQVGLAVGTRYDRVLVGRDTRTSGNALSHSLISGLLSAGARCSDAGVIPTPTVGYGAREFKAGLMLTASHNPPQYNGIKMLNPDGSAFSEYQQNEIQSLIESGLLTSARWDKLHDVESYDAAAEKHVARIIDDFPNNLALRVVVDGGGGAGCFITPYLMEKLGCEVIRINCRATGMFPRDAEPIAANLGDLMDTVRREKADLGIAHDGDADRMMAVDDQGRFIPGDKMLAILANASGTKRVVTTIDASMAIEEMGFTVRRTKVGDPYVSEELKSGGDFGGEPSGAWVFPRISLCPDGIYAAAQVASIAKQTRLSSLVDSISVYPVKRGGVSSVDVDLSRLELRLLAKNPLILDKTDGYRLSFADGWLLVRPSGTEPKIRISAEAKTETRVEELYQIGVRGVEEARVTT